MGSLLEKEYQEYESARETLQFLVGIFRGDHNGFLTASDIDYTGQRRVMGDSMIEDAATANDVFVDQLIPALEVLSTTESRYKPILERAKASTDGRERWRIVQELRSLLRDSA